MRKRRQILESSIKRKFLIHGFLKIIVFLLEINFYCRSQQSLALQMESNSVSSIFNYPYSNYSYHEPTSIKEEKERFLYYDFLRQDCLQSNVINRGSFGQNLSLSLNQMNMVVS